MFKLDFYNIVLKKVRHGGSCLNPNTKEAEAVGLSKV